MNRTLAATLLSLALSPVTFAEPSELPKAPEAPGDPAAPGGHVIQVGPGGQFTFDPPAGVAMVKIMRSTDGAGMNTTVFEDGKQITVSQNDEGIKVSIKEEGKDPQEFTAKDADTLKADSPEAYEYYNKYCVTADRGGGILMLPADPNDPNHGMLHLRELSELGGRIKELDIRIEPMPNPAMNAQLGPGVTIVKVKTEGRGEKLGLKAYDYVRSVNGQSITNGEEFQDALTEHTDGKLKLEILREGKTVTLEE